MSHPMSHPSLVPKPIRLAILGSRGIPARYGGFETFAEELAVRLAASGFAVDVFCESDAAAPKRWYQGVGLVYVRRYRLGPLTTLLFDLACFWKARKGYDIAYMLGYGASFAAFLPRLWGTVVWINMDGLEWARSKWSRPARKWFKWMEWLAMRTPNLAIADAEGIKAHLQKRHGRHHPCAVIAYGAPAVTQSPDPAPLQAWGLRAQDYYLLVCRLEPENHVLEILRGFQASPSRRKLLVVGDIASKAPYVAGLRAVKDARILFAGTVFDKAIIGCLRFHCHAYIHGHSVGGTNPSLLEAMGYGNLVIAHDNPFNREVLGETGIFFDSQGALTEIIGKLEPGGQDFAPLRDGARLRIMETYSWERIADQYIRLATQATRPHLINSDIAHSQILSSTISTPGKP